MEKWRRELAATCGPDLPVCVCGNKCDLVPVGALHSAALGEYFGGPPDDRAARYLVSAQDQTQVEKPFLLFARVLTGDSYLCLA